MLRALQALGFDCQQDPLNKEIQIQGTGGLIPAKEASIHVGNAGTAARFLTAFLALAKGAATIWTAMKRCANVPPCRD